MSKKPTKKSVVAAMKPGQMIEMALDNPEECSSYCSVAWKYSTQNGARENKYIHTSVDYAECTVTFVCTTYEEYLKEAKRELPRHWWKERIRKKKS